MSASFPAVSRDPPFEWEWRGERLRRTRRAVAVLVTPELAGNAAVLLALARIPPGQAAPWHRHAGHEEFVYVLKGCGEFWCEAMGPRAVREGSVNLVPPGVWHLHRAGEEELVFVWGYAPPGEQLQA